MDSNYCRSQIGAFLYHQNLTTFKWLVHGFSLRTGPQKGLEQSLGFNGYQSRETVESNRLGFVQSVSSASGAPGYDSAKADLRRVSYPQLVVLRQCHSDTIHALTPCPS